MKSIFYSLSYLLILFSISQFVFTPMHLFYEIWWLDIPMHILGGALVALLALSIFKYQNKEISFVKIAIFVIVVGILWEIYEYSMYYFFNYDWNGVFDTAKDLFDDLIGASLVYLFNKKSV